MTAWNRVMKQQCSGSCGSTHRVILRDFLNVLAVAVICSSTQLSCKAVALWHKASSEWIIACPKAVRSCNQGFVLALQHLAEGLWCLGFQSSNRLVQFTCKPSLKPLQSCVGALPWLLELISSDCGAVAIRGVFLLLLCSPPASCTLSDSLSSGSGGSGALCVLAVPHSQAGIPAHTQPVALVSVSSLVRAGLARKGHESLLPSHREPGGGRKVPQAKLLPDVPQCGHLLARQSHQSIAQWPERYLVGKCLLLFSSGSHLIRPQRCSTVKALGLSHGWQWVRWGLQSKPGCLQVKNSLETRL